MIMGNNICFGINNESQPNKQFAIKIHSCNSTTTMSTCMCPEIEKVACTKYLGVLVDQRLSWYPHLEHVSSRLRKLTWIFKKLRDVVPRTSAKSGSSDRDILKDVYVSIAQSVLVYCISIWGGSAKTKYLQLERAQRGLIKVMYFKKQRFPTYSLYQLSKLLTVRQLYILNSILKVHKILPYDPKAKKKRRKDMINLSKTNTKFASRQFPILSRHLYNVLNKYLDIHNINYHNCKTNVLKWLQDKTYGETEKLLER
jgi:hypothetical protein